MMFSRIMMLTGLLATLAGIAGARSFAAQTGGLRSPQCNTSLPDLAQLFDLQPQTIRPATVDPVLAVLRGRLNAAPTHPLLLWCAKVLADGASPYWKRNIASDAILGRNVTRVGMQVTYYQPCRPDNKPWHDAALGGGPYPAWGKLRRMLRDGDCAASRSHPFGERLFVAGNLLTVADRGGLVRTYGHIDVCRVRPEDYLRAARAEDQRRERTGSATQSGWVFNNHGRTL